MLYSFRLFSVPGGYPRPGILLRLRLVEPGRDNVRVSIRVRVPFISAFPSLTRSPAFRLSSANLCVFHSLLLWALCIASLADLILNTLLITDTAATIQRHVTRQKILNWRQSLRFPNKPAVSREGIDLMQQLLREPEDRLGSQAASSTIRPNSQIVNARRSGFLTATPGASNDGAELIKVCLSPAVARARRTHGCGRPTLGSVESTGSIFTDIPLHIAPS